MKAVDKKELAPLIREFTELVAGTILVSDGVTSGVLDVDGTLALWMQVPDGQLTPMFLGWILAQGYDLNSFTPSELEQEVQHALVGENKNVMFDWLGDTDAKNKSH